MKNILIVVDVQNGFVRREETKAVSKKIKELLKGSYFDYVFATKFYNRDHSIYEKAMNWNKLKTKQETDLIDGLEKYVDETIKKHIYTCVNVDFLQRLTQINGGTLPERVFLLGIDTDSCVLKIAVDLFENGIIPIVLTEYCASNGGKDSHEAAITCLSRFIGRKHLVMNTINGKNDLEVAST